MKEPVCADVYTLYLVYICEKFIDAVFEDSRE